MILYALFKTDCAGSSFFLGVFSSQEAVDKVIAAVKQEMLNDGYPEELGNAYKFEAFGCRIDEFNERSLR